MELVYESLGMNALRQALLLHFCTPWKLHKTSGFPTFSRGIKKDIGVIWGDFS